MRWAYLAVALSAVLAFSLMFPAWYFAQGHPHVGRLLLLAIGAVGVFATLLYAAETEAERESAGDVIPDELEDVQPQWEDWTAPATSEGGRSRLGVA